MEHLMACDDDEKAPCCGAKITVALVRASAKGTQYVYACWKCDTLHIARDAQNAH
jgi:hypothetical protein